MHQTWLYLFYKIILIVFIVSRKRVTVMRIRQWKNWAVGREFRALALVGEDQGSVPSTLSGSPQPPVTPFLGDPLPSSGILRYQTLR